MVGVVLILLIVNAILFSFIFWILTFLAKWYYSNNYYKYNLNFYECGFKSLTNININYNINFILLFLFILIYDGEFFILIPFAMNAGILSWQSYLLILFFFFWFLIVLFLDVIFNSLDWQV